MRLLRNSLKLKDFPPQHLSVGTWYSDLDARAEKISVGSVDRLFEGAPVQQISSAFSQFFQDTEAKRSLKKEFHVVYESRLRALALIVDPPENYGFAEIEESFGDHPLDVLALADLRSIETGIKLDIQIQWRQRLRHQAEVAIHGVLLAVQVLHIQFCRSARAVELAHSTVAMPNYWIKDRFLPIIQAAKDAGLWSDRSLMFIMERSHSQNVRELGVPCVDPDNLRVPRRQWIEKVSLPSMRLLGKVIFTTFFSKYEPARNEVALASLRLARQSLPIWTVAMNLRSRYVLNLGEYKASHILKRMIYGKFGAKLVRWPATQFDSWSSIASYMSFDIFFSGGEYETKTFGSSWFQDFSQISVGSLQFDRRQISLNVVSPDISGPVKRQLNKGKRLVAFFGTSPHETVIPVMMDNLLVICRLVAERENWVLIVKPKSFKDIYSLARRDPRYEEVLACKNILWVTYGPDDPEICPAGWLVERMEFGVGDPSTIMTETLARGKPFFSRYPVMAKTPLRSQLSSDGYLHTDQTEFSTTLESALDNPEELLEPPSFYRDGFDPFRDDNSLSRMVQIIFNPNSESSPNNTA